MNNENIAGKVIKMLREKHHLTQSDIAKIAQVSDKAVSAWERGLKEPRMGAIQRLADYFGLLNSDFINGISLEDIPEMYSQEEQNIIADFRSLSPDGQRDVLRYIRMIKADEEEQAKKDEENSVSSKRA